MNFASLESNRKNKRSKPWPEAGILAGPTITTNHGAVLIIESGGLKTFQVFVKMLASKWLLVLMEG